MTQEHFLFWFQGFVELTGGERPTPEQWDSIVEHLGLVFNKVTKPVAKKEPAKEILTEEGPVAPPEKDEPVKQAKPYDQDDWMEQIMKQIEEYERIKKASEPFGPHSYPPFIPSQPGWPHNPDWYDPLGYPKIIC